MKRPWFAAEPVNDDSFFTTAPHILRDTFDVKRPAPDVWAEITSGNPLSWCRIIDRIEWTSPPPYGVGTTRTVFSLKGAIQFHEQFFRWEEGRRKSFYVVEASVPGFRRFAEDYVVDPTGDSSCRFTWTIAWESKGAGRALDPGNKAILGTLLKDTRKHFAN